MGSLVLTGTLLLAARACAAAVFQYVDRTGRAHAVRVLAESAPPAGLAPPVALPPPAALPPASPPLGQRSPLPRLEDVGRADAFPYAAEIREAARLYSLPVALLLAVMTVESGFDAQAVSRTGAQGLMQLMPETAAEMGVSRPFDPRQNILGGARYLRILVNEFDGDVLLALAGYNAGAGSVRAYGGLPPFDETRKYVADVLSYYHSYLEDDARPAPPPRRLRKRRLR